MPACRFDICQDAVFKAVFTSAKPQSRIALSSLLSAFIGKNVSPLSVTANEEPISDTRQRQIRYDIAAMFNDGEQANIELMANPKSLENLHMEYNAARLYAGQDIRGKDKSFGDLKHAWQISIAAGGRIFGEDEEWLHKFEYYDRERGISLNGRTGIIVVELSLFQNPVGFETSS
jgi:hypothetical protein